MYNPEIDRKFRPWKMTENHAWKMPEWKLHTLENDRKITPRKMIENAQLEFARMENAHPGKCQKENCTPQIMTKKSHPGK